MPFILPTVTAWEIYCEFFASISGREKYIKLLDYSCWEDMLIRIFEHESGARQYDNHSRYYGPDHRRHGTNPSGPSVEMWFGREKFTPMFGFPQGYGAGQLDPPRNRADMWDTVSNIQGTVERIMVTKGNEAGANMSNYLNTSNGTITIADHHRARATFHRDVIRRYNGGREFQWEASASEYRIRPNPSSRPQYVNKALGRQAPHPLAVPYGGSSATVFTSNLFWMPTTGIVPRNPSAITFP